MKQTLIFTCLVSLAISGAVVAGEQMQQQAGEKPFQSSQTTSGEQAGPEYGKGRSQQTTGQQQRQQGAGQNQQTGQQQEQQESPEYGGGQSQ